MLLSSTTSSSKIALVAIKKEEASPDLGWPDAVEMGRS
jgi:hypothetical protein